MIGGKPFTFSPAVFDSLLGHGAAGAAKMRELGEAVHVSVSSIKDWRRGAHAPSDLEKVEDIARWAHIDASDLLIESGDGTMDEKLSERQLDVLCALWNQAYDFLDLCEETDHLVWPTTDLRCVPGSRARRPRDARTGRSSAISPGIRSRSDPRGAAGTSTASTASRGRPSVTSRATGSDARPTTGRSTFPRGSTITASPPCAGFSPRSRADSANSCANTRTRSMGSITGSSRRGSKMKGTDMQTIHTKAGFKVLRESLGLYQSDVAQTAGVDVKTVKNWESPRLPRCRATAEAWKYLENLAEVQEREVGCLVEKIVGETDVNPYPLPYFREQDLAAEDAREARISNAMTRKVAFELTRLAIPYEFRFEEEAADDERLSEIWDM